VVEGRSILEMVHVTWILLSPNKPAGALFLKDDPARRASP
jgi:hypothetical protein